MEQEGLEEKYLNGQTPRMLSLSSCRSKYLNNISSKHESERDEDK
jgi:hypothetical protein